MPGDKVNENEKKVMLDKLHACRGIKACRMIEKDKKRGEHECDSRFLNRCMAPHT